MAAQREHQRLNSDLTKRVDIFQIIQDAGIWLMFQPLDSLYGAIYGDSQHRSVGILISSQHPPSLQRYTASHEYGHYVLRHAFSLDEGAHIEGPRRDLRDLRELEAQVFAANFLMPIQLVTRLLHRMGLSHKPGELTPRQAYLLSLELGVSYLAAIYRLRDLNKITQENLIQLLQYQPRQIKTDIGNGIRPRNTRADVWELRQSDSGQSLRPYVDDELRATLAELPSSGYLWTVATEDILDLRQGERPIGNGESMPLALIADNFEPQSRSTSGDDVRLGAGGTHYFLFRVLKPGRVRLRLVKKRPWLKEYVPELETFEVELEIAARPTGEKNTGLSERQQPALGQAA